MKRLVICADGTWNEPDQKDRGKIVPSNIVKLSRAVLPEAADGTHQITYYDEGVGTHWGLTRYIEGATGMGLSKNILEAYRFLCLNYVEGDEIYLFGFSRGAFTVRSLASFIDRVGLLPKANVFFTPQAYEMYRDLSSPDQLKAFREEQKSQDVEIKFMGVFDTVGAMGIPISLLKRIGARKYQFHDMTFCDSIAHAYHALAIDEQRSQFVASLWDPPMPVPVSRLEQVWYAGVHTNIGGGYSPDGLANLPLHSIKRRAKKHGLEFDDEYLNHFKAVPDSELRVSRKGIYKLSRKHTRPIGKTKHGNERVHSSVYKRIKKLPDYRPSEVPPKSAEP